MRKAKNKQKKMNEALDCQMALKMAVMLGVRLMGSGAEIYRVEESIHHVLKAYKFKRIDAFVTPNMLMITIETDEEISYTKMRRVYQSDPNFERLARLNDFTRNISDSPLPPKQAIAELEKIDKTKNYSAPVIWASYCLAAASFCLMIGGNLYDGLIAIICVLIARIICTPMEIYHANSFFITVVASFVHNAIAYAFVEVFPTLHFNLIVTGTLMMLFPGVTFMTAIRDVIARDLNAGMIEMLQAVVVASAIAVGSAMAYGIFPMIGGLF